MSGLTWLHISDWHQGDVEYDRSYLSKKLIEDIKRCIKDHSELAKIDFIVFSGDVANNGLASEYEQAIRDLFTPLFEATKLTDSDFWSKLMVVPGNHDMDRRVIKESDDEELRDPLGKYKTPMDKRKALNNYFLQDPRKRMLLLRPFANFRNFVTKYTWGNTEDLSGREPGYFQIRRFVKDGVKVGLVGFNSALLSYRNRDAGGRTNDYGQLIIGERPITEALAEISENECDIRIAVMHHPISWLTDFDRDFVEEQLYAKCHFVLHGHQHLPRVHFIRSTIGETVNIPAGTIYSRRFESNPRYTNSYNFAHLDLDNRRGTVYLRRWDERRDRWVEDDAYRPDGRFSFILPKSIESSKRDIYQTQVSSLVGKISKRFCESHIVTVKSLLQEHGDAKVVRLELLHQLKLCPGAPETFTAEVKVSGNNQVIDPCLCEDSSQVNVSASCFKLNGQSLSSFEVNNNKISYTVQLDAYEANIDYKYVLNMRTDDFFILFLKRFTKHFMLYVEKDANLTYEFVKLGDIPAKRSLYPYSGTPVLAEKYETQLGELCRPEQGFIIQWYPK